MLWLSFLQLKAYAKYQGIPKTYNTDDSGFSLEKDKVTATPTRSLLDVDWNCYIYGCYLICLVLLTFHPEMIKELPKVKEYKLLVTRIRVFNAIICLSEIVELIILVTYWVPGLLDKNFFICFILCGSLLPFSPDAFIITGFLLLILSSLLPTFLLLLVHPFKVVSLFAYTVAFTFFVMYLSLAFSNALHPNAKQLRFYDIIFSMNILVFFSAVTLLMLFLLTMTKAAVFAPGAYGVIPLLPSVFITSGTWILKKNVISKKEANGTTELEKKTK